MWDKCSFWRNSGIFSNSVISNLRDSAVNCRNIKKNYPISSLMIFKNMYVPLRFRKAGRVWSGGAWEPRVTIRWLLLYEAFPQIYLLFRSLWYIKKWFWNNFRKSNKGCHCTLPLLEINEDGHCDCKTGYILSSGVSNTIEQCISCGSNFDSKAFLNERDECSCRDGFQLAENNSFCIQCDRLENKVLSENDECICESDDFLMSENTGECILCIGENRFLEITTDYDEQIMEQCGCGDGFQTGFFDF